MSNGRLEAFVPVHDPHAEQEYWDLARQVPVLDDLMVVNLVNGLEVAGEQLRYQQGRQGLLLRTWDALTGASVRRQQLIAQTHQEGLKAASAWLHHLQSQQLQSDFVITRVAHKLRETREGVMRLAAAHRALGAEVAGLRQQFGEALASLEARHSELDRRLDRLSCRIEARHEIDRVFSAWQSGRLFAGFQPLTQFLLALCTLYWGPYRRYEQESTDLRMTILDKGLVELRRLGAFDRHDLLSDAQWLAPLHSERPMTREMLCLFLQDQLTNEFPVTAALAMACLVEDGEGRMECFATNRPSDLPRSQTLKRWCEKFLNETGERFARIEASQEGIWER